MTWGKHHPFSAVSAVLKVIYIIGPSLSSSKHLTSILSDCTHIFEEIILEMCSISVSPRSNLLRSILPR
jgi:hypothetical protein